MTHFDGNLVTFVCDGHDNLSVRVTENDFYNTLAYLMNIQPKNCDKLGREEYVNSMMPYDFDVRCALSTLKRYALEELGWERHLMQETFKKYSSDPTLIRDNVPRNRVSAYMDLAWNHF